MNLNIFSSNHLRQLLLSVSQQVQSPVPIAVNSILAVLAVSMQDFLQVELPIGFRIRVHLYLLTIADSGDRKSATEKLFIKPVYDFDQMMQQANQDLLTQYEIDYKVWQLKSREIEKSWANAIRRGLSNQESLEADYQAILAQKPNKPLLNKRIFKDTTIESLLYESSQSRTGAFLTSTEAGSFLSRLNAHYSSVLNSIWDGDSVQVNRKSSDSFKIEDPSLTCSLMVQPDLFEQIHQTKEHLARGSGLWARFLICKPESIQGTRFIGTLFKNYYLEEFQERITELLKLSSQFKEMNKIITLTFDPLAQKKWIECANAIEQELRIQGRLYNVKDFASKIMNNISRIAALLYFYEHGDKYGQTSLNTAIDSQTLETAIGLGKYYTLQFKSLFGEKTFAEESRAYGVLLYNYLVTNYDGSVSVLKSRLFSNAPPKIRPKDKLNMAINELINNGYLVHIVGSSPVCFSLTQKFLTENNLIFWNNSIVY